MDDSVLGRRLLMATDLSGNRSLFKITIYKPVKVGSTEYECRIYSDNIIFDGEKSVFGIDEIDSIDQAIKFIDVIVNKFKRAEIFWPDGSPYIRVVVSDKMGWGEFK